MLCIVGWMGGVGCTRPSASTPAEGPRGASVPSRANPGDGGKLHVFGETGTPRTVHGFCIAKKEVTLEEYEVCVRKGACTHAGARVEVEGISPEQVVAWSGFCNVNHPGRGAHPVNCVDWFQADAYCKDRGERLPSELEWEFACRGPEMTAFPWGNAIATTNSGNYCDEDCAATLASMGAPEQTSFTGHDGAVGTSAVGSFSNDKSKSGVLDMSGNVMEWTSDAYSEDLRVQQRQGEEMAIRSGSWYSVSDMLTSCFYRFWDAPIRRSSDVGFRCARDPMGTFPEASPRP